MPTVHIAGFPVRVGTRKRQRCAWCGEVLIDEDLKNVAVYPPPKDGEELVAHFEPNALVAVDGPGSWIVRHEDGAPLPAGWCGDERPPLRLVEEQS